MLKKHLAKIRRVAIRMAIDELDDSFFAKNSDKAWCAHWFSSLVVGTSTTVHQSMKSGPLMWMFSRINVFIAKLLFVVHKQKSRLTRR
jgi:hypothetical protein